MIASLFTKQQSIYTKKTVYLDLWDCIYKERLLKSIQNLQLQFEHQQVEIESLISS